jgi:hypothetical protein
MLWFGWKMIVNAQKNGLEILTQILTVKLKLGCFRFFPFLCPFFFLSSFSLLLCSVRSVVDYVLILLPYTSIYYVHQPFSHPYVHRWTLKKKSFTLLGFLTPFNIKNKNLYIWNRGNLLSESHRTTSIGVTSKFSKKKSGAGGLRNLPP